VGDFLLQTDWQARHKQGGLGADPIRRRALLTHVATYTAAFLPALVWIGLESDAAWAVAMGAVIAIPHLIQDDGRLLDAYMARVKGLSTTSSGLRVAVDQSFHAVFLFGTALLVVA
jgi:mannitol/fructose-specific phosphotransferase system IIA component